MRKKITTISEEGFSVIELMVVVGIVGFLASIVIPNFVALTGKAEVGVVAQHLRTFEDGFRAYSLADENAGFPDDFHLPGETHLPAGLGLEDFIPVENWANRTPLGGFYNWEGPDSYPYAGISLFNNTATQEELTQLDKILDNGDLNTGKFRRTGNGRYTYILEE